MVKSMTYEKITGLMIYYYFVCKRKLWLFCNDISLEDENENVKLGKFIDENTYQGERKHLMINDEINIDFVKRTGTIHEIKKSRKIEEASIWQVKYYLYYLKKYGLEGITAKIDYPLLKQTIDVSLSQKDEVKLNEVIKEMFRILKNDRIPNFNGGICSKCAFHDLCKI